MLATGLGCGPCPGQDQVTRQDVRSSQCRQVETFETRAPMMAATDLDILREKACAAYPAAAEGPQEKHTFPVGRAFAESVGYSAEPLNRNCIRCFWWSFECLSVCRHCTGRDSSRLRLRSWDGESSIAR